MCNEGLGVCQGKHSEECSQTHYIVENEKKERGREEEGKGDHKQDKEKEIKRKK